MPLGFSQGPNLPDPRTARGASAWVVDQAHDGSGIVRVTFATANLDRIVVSVPYESWVAGAHLAIEGRLLAHLNALDPAGQAENAARRRSSR